MTEYSFNPKSSTCLICGSPNLRQFTANANDFDKDDDLTVNITECTDCFFAWQYPYPDKTIDNVKYFEWARTTKSDYFNLEKKRESSQPKLDFMSDLPISGNTLLELGAGEGMFAVVAAEEGWEVTAVDPVLNIDLFTGLSNVNPIRGTIDSIPKKMTFDIVTMWDVIEHLSNPIEVISSIRNCLKDEGWIIIETGNYKSAGRIASYGKSWIYQQGHKWYFSPDSIQQLLTDYGFSEFRVSDRVLTPTWNGTTNYPGPSLLNYIKCAVKDPLAIPKYLSIYLNLLKARRWNMAGLGIFAIAAKKKKL